MAQGLITNTYLENIADAIRFKSGSSDTYTPAQMAPAINNISGGSGGITNVFLDGMSIPQNDVTGLIGDKPNSVEARVYCNNIASINGTSYDNSVLEKDVTWEAVTNGFYNAQYNTYIYNNYLPMQRNSSLYGKFQGDATFNLAIKTSRAVTNMSQMLNGCSNFNNSIQISDSVTNISGMCNNCYNFNSPVTIGNNVQDMGAAFRNAYSFNQPITIPESATNCRTMLQNTKFNQPLIISNNVTNCKWMLFDCAEFNQPITIGSKVVDCSQMMEVYRGEQFGGKFNYPVTLPDSCVYAPYFLMGQELFNHDITFPYNTTDITLALYDCNSFGSNIFIERSSGVNVIGLIGGRDWGNRVNVFCNNSSMLTATGASSSITETDISWTAMEHGYYNSQYNVYLYNNFCYFTDSSLFGRFQGNAAFDCVIRTANSVTNMGYMMNACSNFNSDVEIGPNVTNCRSILMDCTNYNRPIHFPNSVVNARSALWGCTNFNSPVTFDDAQYNIDLRGLLCDTAFNLPITLPNGTRNCQALFQNCHNFNQPIVIPDSVDSTEGAAYFLFNATSFNSSITIGNNVTNCHQMMEAYWWDGSTDHFEGGSFNQPIIFPKSVATAMYALAGQQNMKSDILLHNNACYYDCFLGNAHYEGNIYCPNGIWASRINNMFSQKNNTSGIASIYTPQSYSDYNDAIRSYTLTGNSDTWVGDETNELVYSPTANIYIYCNWNGALPEYFQ